MSSCYIPIDVYPPRNDLNIIREGNILENGNYVVITKKWLNKFGFFTGKEKYEKNTYRLGSYQLYWEAEAGRVFVWAPYPSWQFANMSWCCNESIRYVHELQNIYFYSEGKDLVIT